MPNGPIYQARTHNHLTWVMVDATDFATPESALSGAKIMVNGKLQSTSLLYFVSSGTGSMAGGDIKHVGASATGVYTVNLVKADLSDASAAWYDQYIFTITGTGAAQQVIVCEGVLAKNTISNISDYLSKMSDVLSNAYSAAAQGTSQTILTKTQATAAASRATKIYSMASDTLSTMNSQFAVTSNYLSNASNYLSNFSNYLSNISAFASDIDSALTSQFTIVNSRVKGNSDFLSKMSDAWSDTLVFATAAASRALLNQSTLSNIFEVTSDVFSGLALIPKSDGVLTFNATAVGNIKAGLATQSNLDSAADQIDATLSDMFSTMGSQFTVLQTATTLTNSRLLVNQSTASNIYELLSDVDSALSSQFTKDLSQFNKISSNLSDFHSDFQSQFVKTNSQLNVNVITVNDTYSLLSAVNSDIQARVPKEVAARSQVSDLASDIKSAVGAITVALTASDISDIASAVAAEVGTTINDIYSLLSGVNSDVGTVKTQTNKLTFTVSGVVDANIQRINDVTITGDGTVGDKFDVV